MGEKPGVSGSANIGDDAVKNIRAAQVVVGLTKTAALEYVQQGIRINAVCPGSVMTPMVKSSIDAFPDLEKILLSKHPMGRFARSEEIADAVLWLSSDGASYVTGIALSVDGGVVAQ